MMLLAFSLIACNVDSAKEEGTGSISTPSTVEGNSTTKGDSTQSTQTANGGSSSGSETQPVSGNNSTDEPQGDLPPPVPTDIFGS